MPGRQCRGVRGQQLGRRARVPPLPEGEADTAGELPAAGPHAGAQRGRDASADGRPLGAAAGDDVRAAERQVPGAPPAVAEGRRGLRGQGRQVSAQRHRDRRQPRRGSRHVLQGREEARAPAAGGHAAGRGDRPQREHERAERQLLRPII